MHYFATTEDQAAFEQAMREAFGPTYRGVPVPPEHRLRWGRELTAALAWRQGVDAALAAQTEPAGGECHGHQLR